MTPAPQDSRVNPKLSRHKSGNTYENQNITQESFKLQISVITSILTCYRQNTCVAPDITNVKVAVGNQKTILLFLSTVDALNFGPCHVAYN